MRLLQLPKLYPITDTKLSGLSHAEQVSRLIAGGATLIQLRDKQASPAEFYEAAVEAVTIARQKGVKIIINDRVDIALALGADGVHLGQDDLPPEKARRILGPTAIIGLSTHMLEQAKRAASARVDYIAFGPIFTTTTKEDPDPTVGIEALSKVRELVGPTPLVAIGGINERNIHEAIAAGADSTAVISCLLLDADEITAKTAVLLNIVKN